MGVTVESCNPAAADELKAVYAAHERNSKHIPDGSTPDLSFQAIVEATLGTVF
jgi:hypothetical protein